MLKRLGVILLWLLATIGTASLTYAAVTQADRAIGDAPAGPVAGADIAARISTTTAPVEEATAATTTTTTLSLVTDSTATTVSPSTTIASPPTTVSASPTTTAAASTQWKTVPGVGTVGVAVSGDSVTFKTAQPVAPYDVDVEDDGPETVVVEFESESADYLVRAEVRDGQLVWEVIESLEGDD